MGKPEIGALFCTVLVQRDSDGLLKFEGKRPIMTTKRVKNLDEFFTNSIEIANATKDLSHLALGYVKTRLVLKDKAIDKKIRCGKIYKTTHNGSEMYFAHFYYRDMVSKTSPYVSVAKGVEVSTHLSTKVAQFFRVILEISPKVANQLMVEQTKN